MSFDVGPIVIVFLACAAAALAAGGRSGEARPVRWRLGAFVVLCAIPVALTSVGTAAHLDHAKTTEFCGSCHEMGVYTDSLHLADPAYLPAVHYLDGLVPRDEACYSCHTRYTMFGGVKAKMNGLRHVWVHYLGQAPESVELYEEYSNQECMRCHAGARSFEDLDLHVEVRAELAVDEVSCLECHDLVHAADQVDSLERWGEADG